MAQARDTRSFLLPIVLLLSVFFTPLVYAYPTAKTLDHYWDKRQSIGGQNAIIKFLSLGETIPQNFDIAWRVARLVYFAGNFGAGYDTFSKEKKMGLFKYGFEAANIARKTKPERVEGYYWYATNLGSYGMTKGVFSALSYAEEARDSLLQAAKIDPKYHWGGPYRILGRFYQEAPGFISFGDKKKAEHYFNLAIETVPDFRLNTIYLGVLKKQEGNLALALELLNDAKKKPKVDGNLEENRYLTELEKGIQKLKSEIEG